MIGRFALLLSLAGCLAFGALVLVEIEAPSPARPTAIAPARPGAAAAVSRPLPAPRLDDLVATALARPLFSATRRPPQEADNDDSRTDELGNMRLTGIVIAPTGRFAIFAVSGAKPLAVAEGGDVSGWRIDGIAPSEISLSGPGGVKTLQPKPDSSLVRSAAAPHGPSTKVVPPRRNRRPEATRAPVPPVPIPPMPRLPPGIGPRR